LCSSFCKLSPSEIAFASGKMLLMKSTGSKVSDENGSWFCCCCCCCCAVLLPPFGRGVGGGGEGRVVEDIIAGCCFIPLFSLSLSLLFVMRGLVLSLVFITDSRVNIYVYNSNNNDNNDNTTRNNNRTLGEGGSSSLSISLPRRFRSYFKLFLSLFLSLSLSFPIGHLNSS